MFFKKIRTQNALNDIKDPKVLLGKLLASQNNQLPQIKSLEDVEFSVFSQWGDDGIIQYLIHILDIPHKTFIEFGVENYRESNTRFLLINNNWSGLVMDGSESNIHYIWNDVVSWGYELHASAAFITKENINERIKGFLKKGYHPEIGLLSIDIDGNDFWIWKEIDSISPVIVIIEYNSLFGCENAYTIPYQNDFERYKADPSLQYYGASLKALCLLAEQKGYAFIGCNSNGNNAYFIRKDKVRNIKIKSPEEGYVESRFREFILNGERVSGKDRYALLKGKKVFNTVTNNIEIIS